MGAIMQQIQTIRNLGIIAAGTVLAFAGGWFGFNSFLLNGYGSESARFMAGVLALVLAWRFCVRTRLSAWLVLAGWYLGASIAIPSAWAAFFGDDWGWATWMAFAALSAAPALILPSRLTPLALSFAAVVTTLTPIGMVNPVLAATAFFPGLGWLGLLLALALLSFPYIKHEKLFTSGLIVAALAGTVLNTKTPNPVQPEGAWAVETREGAHPTLVVEWFARQARVTLNARAFIEGGATLVVTPEGTVDSWDAWSKLAWKKTAEAAKKHRSMLLVGVYRHAPGSRIWQDGLLDMTTGKFYGASMPMPTSMWKPWDDKEHYPIDLSQLPRTIQTPQGEAAYLICYEEMLLWPLAAKMAAGNPSFLISVVNQWFTTSTTSFVPQERSIRLQARLWGLPLVRAANWPR